jgi:ribosome-associated heat shock protein Hsp15
VLATKLIAGGKVRVNGERILKLARQVKPGDVVTGTSGGRLFVVRVAGEAERRGPASTAKSLYEDLTPKPQPETSDPTRGPVPGGPRPTKRDRRRLDALHSKEK